MKTLIAALFLFASTSYAQSPSNFTCKVQNPCQYSKSGLGYCLGSIRLRINDMSSSGPYSHVVVEQANVTPFEVFVIAADIPVSYSANEKTFSGSTEDGDDWVTLKFAQDQKSAFGKMTLEQDFEFNLVCNQQR